MLVIHRTAFVSCVWCTQNMMALGMYRCVSSDLSPAHVFTNPSPTELVMPHDLIFVIW